VTSGKLRHMRRIFREDGRTVIVAVDHGGFFGTQTGLEQPGGVFQQVVQGGADAVMTTYGLAQHFAAELSAVGLILRVDGGVSRLGTRAWRGRPIFSAEAALRLGADGVVAMGFPGAENEDQILRGLADLSDQCGRWGLPLVAEMLPRGFEGGEDSRSPDNIALAVRIAAELGVDIIKTQYTGEVESFRKVVAGSFVPVVVLGGPKMEDDAATLRAVREAMDAGGRGVAMGRNIWGHRSPQKMTQAVAAIVHTDVLVEQALEMLK
jgi:DhnA family fructose-bisphosphate aldolase class Ia